MTVIILAAETVAVLISCMIEGLQFSMSRYALREILHTRYGSYIWSSNYALAVAIGLIVVNLVITLLLLQVTSSNRQYLRQLGFIAIGIQWATIVFSPTVLTE